MELSNLTSKLKTTDISILEMSKVVDAAKKLMAQSKIPERLWDLHLNAIDFNNSENLKTLVQHQEKRFLEASGKEGLTTLSNDEEPTQEELDRILEGMGM